MLLLDTESATTCDCFVRVGLKARVVILGVCYFRCLWGMFVPLDSGGSGQCLLASLSYDGLLLSSGECYSQ